MHVISASAGQASAGTTEDSETGDSRSGSFAQPRMQRVGRTIIEYYLKPRPCESCKMLKFQVRLVPRRERAPSRTPFVHEQYLQHPEPLEPEDDEDDDVVIDMTNESMFDASKAVLKARQEVRADEVLIEFKKRGEPDVCASLSHLPAVFLVMWARCVVVADPETGYARPIKEVPVVAALSHKNIVLNNSSVPLANVYVLTRSVLQVEHQYVDLKMALLLDTGEKSFIMADGTGPSSLRLSMRATNPLESESVWSERSAFNSRSDSFIGQTSEDDRSEEPDMEHLERFIRTQRQRNTNSMARRARAPQVMQQPPPPSSSSSNSSFVGRILSSVIPGSSASKPTPLKKEEMVLEFFGEEEDSPPAALDTTPLQATAGVARYGGAESMRGSGNGYIPSNESSSETERRRQPPQDRCSPRSDEEVQEEEEKQLSDDNILVERVLVRNPESLASASESSSEDDDDDDEDDDDDDDDDSF